MFCLPQNFQSSLLIATSQVVLKETIQPYQHNKLNRVVINQIKSEEDKIITNHEHFLNKCP